MSQKRLLCDVEKLIACSKQTINAYDSRWQDLRELNVAVSAVEARIQQTSSATDIADRRNTIKGKKNAG